MREWIGDRLIHVGWAFFGQECHCDRNRITNWLARLVGEGRWTDEGEPADWWTWIMWQIGHWVVSAANRLYR